MGRVWTSAFQLILEYSIPPLLVCSFANWIPSSPDQCLYMYIPMCLHILHPSQYAYRHISPIQFQELNEQKKTTIFQFKLNWRQLQLSLKIDFCLHICKRYQYRCRPLMSLLAPQCSSIYNSLWGIHSISHHPLHPVFWLEAQKANVPMCQCANV